MSDRKGNTPGTIWAVLSNAKAAMTTNPRTAKLNVVKLCRSLLQRMGRMNKMMT